MRYQGQITTWMDDKGYGFIQPNGGGDQVFLHISSLTNRQRRPVGNELVTYELRTDGKGRAQASSVLFVGEKPAAKAHTGRSLLPTVFVTCFLTFVVTVAFAGRLPLIVLALYLATSLLAFFAYAIDKSAAKSNQWRTQESTLHLLALLGGWPGAFAAQRLLRHKSAKESFQAVFWITVALNCGALGWLVSPFGVRTLRSVLGGA
jgi:uncharacterized membrane protein YsdA (DUF1294 family)/cold shock CspA family protein